MNYTTNDKGQAVIAVGAPGSLARQATILASNYRAELDVDHNERQAAKRAVMATECDKVKAEASLCRFNRRRYGAQFYCWAIHPVYGDLGDPWPASNWPQANLAVALAIKAFGS